MSEPNAEARLKEALELTCLLETLAEAASSKPSIVTADTWGGIRTAISEIKGRLRDVQIPEELEPQVYAPPVEEDSHEIIGDQPSARAQASGSLARRIRKAPTAPRGRVRELLGPRDTQNALTEADSPGSS